MLVHNCDITQERWRKRQKTGQSRKKIMSFKKLLVKLDIFNLCLPYVPCVPCFQTPPNFARLGKGLDSSIRTLCKSSLLHYVLACQWLLVYNTQFTFCGLLNTVCMANYVCDCEIANCSAFYFLC